jgi:Ca2+-binding RTX toxin-like protein
VGEAVHRLSGGPDNDWLEISTDVPSIANGGDGDDYLKSTFEGELDGGDGDDILESATELASNRMTGGNGADEFRCYGANDIVEDFDADEGDTMLGTCES